MLFSEESSDGYEYIGEQSLGNSMNKGSKGEARKYISRGFLPLIGRHMYQLASSSVNQKIIRKHNLTVLVKVEPLYNCVLSDTVYWPL